MFWSPMGSKWFGGQKYPFKTQKWLKVGLHISQLPYLCEGDLSRAYYVLDDAVFLLNAMPYHTHGEPTNLEYEVTQRNEL